MEAIHYISLLGFFSVSVIIVVLIVTLSKTLSANKKIKDLAFEIFEFSEKDTKPKIELESKVQYKPENIFIGHGTPYENKLRMRKTVYEKYKKKLKIKKKTDPVCLNLIDTYIEKCIVNPPYIFHIRALDDDGFEQLRNDCDFISEKFDKECTYEEKEEVTEDE